MASLIVPAVFTNRKKSVRVRALLDTGAEMTLLSSMHAKKLGLKDLGPVGVRGAGGKASLRLAKVDAVNVPGTRCNTGSIYVIVFDEKAFPLGGLTGLGSILGLDFMQLVKMKILAFKESSIIQCGV